MIFDSETNFNRLKAATGGLAIGLDIGLTYVGAKDGIPPLLGTMLALNLGAGFVWLYDLVSNIGSQGGWNTPEE